ncbi:Amino acid transporter [Entamoeba marina]
MDTFKSCISLYYKNLLLFLGPEMIIAPMAIKFATPVFGYILILFALAHSFTSVWLMYSLNTNAQFDSIHEISWRFGGNQLQKFTKAIQVCYNLLRLSIYITLISAFTEYLLNHAKGETEGTFWTSNSFLKVLAHIVIFLLSISSYTPLISKISINARLYTMCAYGLLLISSISHFIHIKIVDENQTIYNQLAQTSYTLGDGLSIFPFFICIFATHNNLPLVSPSIPTAPKYKFLALFAALLTVGVYVIVYGSFVYATLLSQTHSIPMLFYTKEFYDKYYILFVMDITVASMFVWSFVMTIPSLFTAVHEIIDDHFFSEWKPSFIRHVVIAFVFTSIAGCISSLFWMDDVQITINGSIFGVILIYFIPGIVCSFFGERLVVVIVSVVVVFFGMVWFAVGIVYSGISMALVVSGQFSQISD